MNRTWRKTVLAAGAAAVMSLAGAGTARAVSGGGNQPSQQDCPANGDAWNTASGYVYPGCHNMAVNVESGGTTNGNPSSDNTRYAEVGLDQLPVDSNSQGTPTPLSVGYPGDSGSPHSGCVAANTDGTGGGQTSSTGYGCGNNADGLGGSAHVDYYQAFCPVAAALGLGCEDPNAQNDNPSQVVSVTPDTGGSAALQPILAQGLLVYFGMDDNIDNGEHDGVSGSNNTDGVINGPSDGGGITVSVTPQNATSTPSATNPEGLANASTGFCADGICGEATTQQQTVYYGCNASTGENPADDQCAPGTPSSSDVYDYSHNPSVNSEPTACNSGGATSEDTTSCNGSMNQYRQQTAQQVNAEPGVQVYSDPDPQRSPAAPWPTPGIYAGTCGVSVNGGGWLPGVSGGQTTC